MLLIIKQTLIIEGITCSYFLNVKVIVPKVDWGLGNAKMILVR